MKKFIIVLLAALSLPGIMSCASQPAAEKPKPAPVAPKSPSKSPSASSQNDLIIDGSAKSYTVQRGDTLSAIAKKIWGQDKGYYFPVIILASKLPELNSDPDIIEPGMQLTVPGLEVNLANSKARAAIKNCLKNFSEIYSRKFNESRNPRQSRTSRELAKLSDSL
ncbi:MAG: LysM peptidoglycan-binding domain-containing protein [Spirochaetaceae bacterium]|jgi:Tfp pilus assembly protein FimV|nr:LysM peptidoglycan-binding domain-containing protein [Spirochaetaceae bacterium]